jgi:hypothetical protein
MQRETTNWENLTDELGLPNILLLREVSSQSYGANQSDPFHGLVLSEQEVLSLLTNKLNRYEAVQGEAEWDREMMQIEARIARLREGCAIREAPPLIQLATLYQLERIEQQCLLLCLALEIDADYAKVFAFLQNDLTRKQPTVDLALKLFCKGMQERIAARAIFSPSSRLLRNRLIHLSDATDGMTGLLQRELKIDDRIAAFLLETPQLDGYLPEWVEFVAPADEPVHTALPEATREQIYRLVEGCFSDGEAPIRPVIHLYGRKGSGRRSVAMSVSRRIGLPLLIADISKLPQAATERIEALWRLGRESLLLPAAILVEHFDDLQQEGRSAELSALLEAVREFSPLTCLSGTKPWQAHLSEQLFISLACPIPDSSSRIEFWKWHLQGVAHELCASDLIELSSKFNFTDGQIRDAIKAAQDRAYLEHQPPQPLTAALLNQACREIATPNLGGLARKIETGFSWTDIVLPESQLLQLREITIHINRAQVVLERWGFFKKFPYGQGVTALFEGLSGTGKTMAASIIAAELGLDLYKIDLSCVVSKYIGETEKNLSRIFDEARDSSAILFFDEADALCGKRSEVKDAHDRYANLETAYLLQQMEDYNGGVILATNMKQNMDEAFFRRLRFVIHFPFPGDADRLAIWEKSFPAEAPLDPSVDFRWLARKLKISGGHIKNISLRAAFLAVERQSLIDMDCLIDAAKREVEKMGKVSPLGDFRPPESREDSLKAVEVA